ncbi:hypothetical protein RvY_12463 [Ramazzottius varieornatus]|uniref:Uncharacterized protein n=1 Tax=Ramazzottius varieornatus TaxID=947166 RepID=A0A1D1VS79_RAMVA|nr:hypothetical protein RvY_12463 [Ramazzottius varieornatus]
MRFRPSNFTYLMFIVYAPLFTWEVYGGGGGYKDGYDGYAGADYFGLGLGFGLDAGSPFLGSYGFGYPFAGYPAIGLGGLGLGGYFGGLGTLGGYGRKR